MESRRALGAFLRARRGQVRPEDVGVETGPRRRVAGLRREELAALAGISADYYVRMEQGRDVRPSPDVLAALARALRLNEESAAHLRELAGMAPPPDAGEPELVEQAFVELIERLGVPAFIVGRYLDCLASNQLARALSPNLAPGSNVMRALLLDPAERLLHVHWDRATAGVVGALRQYAGSSPSDVRLDELVDDLSGRSERFRILWTRADVGHPLGGDTHLRHPVVGDLHLERRRFDIPESPGQHFHAYTAITGTGTDAKLRALAELSRGID